MKKDITKPGEAENGFKYIHVTGKCQGEEIDKIIGYKKMICNMSGCDKSFWSELDKMGIPYQHRCDRCKKNLQNAARISRNKIEYRERVTLKKSRTVCDD